MDIRLVTFFLGESRPSRIGYEHPSWFLLFPFFCELGDYDDMVIAKSVLEMLDEQFFAVVVCEIRVLRGLLREID